MDFPVSSKNNEDSDITLMNAAQEFPHIHNKREQYKMWKTSFLAILLSQISRTFTDSEQKCPADYFYCESGEPKTGYDYGGYDLQDEMDSYHGYEFNRACIPMMSRCDNNNDCSDNSDESNCTDHVKVCMTYLCDDVMNCADGSDECGCNGTTTCNEGSSIKCVPASLKCDGTNHCDDGYDETNGCDWFNCVDNRNRVLSSQLCDGINDCNDITASDECNCSTTTTCGNGRCLQQRQVCDGVKDCFDGSDECGCANYSGDVMFQCLESGVCVDERKVCDGKLDCGSYVTNEINRVYAMDCSDEAGCGTIFVCDDAITLQGDVIDHNVLTCVLAWQQCNGKPDCADGSDECGCDDSVRCNEDDVRHSEVTMGILSRGIIDRSNLKKFGANKPHVQCLLRHNFCDGKSDCDYDTDEMSIGFGFKCLVNASSNPHPCVLPQNMIDDGVVDCKQQLDKCQRDGRYRCFRCIDNSMTISDKQVCDDVIDCPDLSDECLCAKGKTLDICDAICNPYDVTMNCTKGTIKCGQPPKDLKFSQVCNGNVDCEVTAANSVVVDEEHCVFRQQLADVIIKCPRGGSAHPLKPQTASKCDFRPECSDFSDECDKNDPCPNVLEYCHHLFSDFGVARGEMRFNCSSGLHEDSMGERGLLGGQVCDGTKNCVGGEDELYCPHRHKCITGDDTISIDTREMCNGKINCLDKSDELNCSQYFYCENGNPLFVMRSAMHDGSDDCSDKSDECPSNEMESRFASATEMIAHPMFKAMVWIMALLSLIGNLVVVSRQIYTLYGMPKRSRNSIGASNHILILNLAIADLLTATYLSSIAFYSVKFSGVYCQRDKTWRSGTTCINMGFLCSVATETSVIILVIMTSSRLYSVFRPFNTSHVTARKTGIACICGWLLSLLFMLPPRLERFEDYFANSVWYPNKFHSSDIITKQELILFVKKLRIISDNISEEIGEGWNSIEQVAQFHNPHNQHKFVKFGYYSKHSVCIPNMLATPQDPAVYFSAIVTLFNLIAIVYVIVAYVMIYRKATKSSKVLRTPKTDKSSSKDPRSVAMQRRIFRLVASNVLCWGPLTVMAVIQISGTTLPPDVYAVTAIILLPINSALNPILYSNLFDMLCGCFTQNNKQSIASPSNATVSTRDVTAV